MTYLKQNTSLFLLLCVLGEMGGTGDDKSSYYNPNSSEPNSSVYQSPLQLGPGIGVTPENKVLFRRWTPGPNEIVAQDEGGDHTGNTGGSANSSAESVNGDNDEMDESVNGDNDEMDGAVTVNQDEEDKVVIVKEMGEIARRMLAQLPEQNAKRDQNPQQAQQVVNPTQSSSITNIRMSSNGMFKWIVDDEVCGMFRSYLQKQETLSEIAKGVRPPNFFEWHTKNKIGHDVLAFIIMDIGSHYRASTKAYDTYNRDRSTENWKIYGSEEQKCKDSTAKLIEEQKKMNVEQECMKSFLELFPNGINREFISTWGKCETQCSNMRTKLVNLIKEVDQGTQGQIDAVKKILEGVASIKTVVGLVEAVRGAQLGVDAQGIDQLDKTDLATAGIFLMKIFDILSKNPNAVYTLLGERPDLFTSVLNIFMSDNGEAGILTRQILFSVLAQRATSVLEGDPNLWSLIESLPNDILLPRQKKIRDRIKRDLIKQTRAQRGEERSVFQKRDAGFAKEKVVVDTQSVEMQAAPQENVESTTIVKGKQDPVLREVHKMLGTLTTEEVKQALVKEMGDRLKIEQVATDLSIPIQVAQDLISIQGAITELVEGGGGPSGGDQSIAFEAGAGSEPGSAGVQARLGVVGEAEHDDDSDSSISDGGESDIDPEDDERRKGPKTFPELKKGLLELGSQLFPKREELDAFITLVGETNTPEGLQKFISGDFEEVKASVKTTIEIQRKFGLDLERASQLALLVLDLETLKQDEEKVEETIAKIKNILADDLYGQTDQVRGVAGKSSVKKDEGLLPKEARKELEELVGVLPTSDLIEAIKDFEGFLAEKGKKAPKSIAGNPKAILFWSAAINGFKNGDVTIEETRIPVQKLLESAGMGEFSGLVGLLSEKDLLEMAKDPEKFIQGKLEQVPDWVKDKHIWLEMTLEGEIQTKQLRELISPIFLGGPTEEAGLVLKAAGDALVTAKNNPRDFLYKPESEIKALGVEVLAKEITGYFFPEGRDRALTKAKNALEKTFEAILENNGADCKKNFTEFMQVYEKEIIPTESLEEICTILLKNKLEEYAKKWMTDIGDQLLKLPSNLTSSDVSPGRGTPAENLSSLPPDATDERIGKDDDQLREELILRLEELARETQDTGSQTPRSGTPNPGADSSNDRVRAGSAMSAGNPNPAGPGSNADSGESGRRSEVIPLPDSLTKPALDDLGRKEENNAGDNGRTGLQTPASSIPGLSDGPEDVTSEFAQIMIDVLPQQEVLAGAGINHEVSPIVGKDQVRQGPSAVESSFGDKKEGRQVGAKAQNASNVERVEPADETHESGNSASNEPFLPDERVPAGLGRGSFQTNKADPKSPTHPVTGGNQDANLNSVRGGKRSEGAQVGAEAQVLKHTPNVERVEKSAEEISRIRSNASAAESLQKRGSQTPSLGTVSPEEPSSSSAPVPAGTAGDVLSTEAPKDQVPGFTPRSNTGQVIEPEGDGDYTAKIAEIVKEIVAPNTEAVEEDHFDGTDETFLGNDGSNIGGTEVGSNSNVIVGSDESGIRLQGVSSISIRDGGSESLAMTSEASSPRAPVQLSIGNLPPLIPGSAADSLGPTSRSAIPPIKLLLQDSFTAGELRASNGASDNVLAEIGEGTGSKGSAGSVNGNPNPAGPGSNADSGESGRRSEPLSDNASSAPIGKDPVVTTPKKTTSETAQEVAKAEPSGPTLSLVTGSPTELSSSYSVPSESHPHTKPSVDPKTNLIERGEDKTIERDLKGEIIQAILAGIDNQQNKPSPDTQETNPKSGKTQRIKDLGETKKENEEDKQNQDHGRKKSISVTAQDAIKDNPEPDADISEGRGTGFAFPEYSEDSEKSLEFSKQADEPQGYTNNRSNKVKPFYNSKPKKHQKGLREDSNARVAFNKRNPPKKKPRKGKKEKKSKKAKHSKATEI